MNQIKSLIPNELELDTFQGKSWITIVPLKVAHQRFHFLPEIPLLNAYLELNVRTYVKYKGIQGVFFFTLDANHPLAVLGARTFSLPYRHAKMDMQPSNKDIIFKSERIFERSSFSVSYEPVGAFKQTVTGSLDHWLLERYCLFTKWGNLLLRGDISHEKWEVSNANVRIGENSVTPFKLPNEPALLHYSLNKETVIFPLKKV